MILETLLSLQLVTSTPTVSFNLFAARSYSSRSYSRPSYSSSGNVVINRRVSTPSVTSYPTPVSRSTSGNVIINRQVTTSPKSIAPIYKPKPSTVYVAPRTQVIRGTYVERDSGGGNFLSNPFFWMYMNESNRNRAPQQVVTNASSVVPRSSTEALEQRQVYKTVDYNPLREFGTFALGSGVTVLLMLKLKGV